MNSKALIAPQRAEAGTVAVIVLGSSQVVIRVNKRLQ